MNLSHYNYYIWQTFLFLLMLCTRTVHCTVLFFTLRCVNSCQSTVAAKNQRENKV